MLARAIIPGTLFLAGSAVAGAVLPARDVTTSSVVPVTHTENQPFTSVIAATSYAYDVTQPVPTSSYVGDGVQAWSSSVGPTYTSAPCYCPVPVSIPPPCNQTSSLAEPIMSTVTMYPSSSDIPTAVTSSIQEPSATAMVVTDGFNSSDIPTAVTSSIQEPSATTMAVTVGFNSSDIPDAVTSSIQEPTATTMAVTVGFNSSDIPDAVTSGLPEPTLTTIVTTMVVTIFPTSSGISGPVTMCACGAASSSGAAFTSSQSFVDQTTQPATTQSIQGVVTTQAVSTSSQTETASIGNNLLLNANSAVMGVVSVQLVAIATLFGLVGAGFTLI